MDLDERAGHYRAAGWTAYDAHAGDYDETQTGDERSRHGTGLGAAAASLRDANEEPVAAPEMVGRTVRVRTYTWTPPR